MVVYCTAQVLLSRVRHGQVFRQRRQFLPLQLSGGEVWSDLVSVWLCKLICFDEDLGWRPSLAIVIVSNLSMLLQIVVYVLVILVRVCRLKARREGEREGEREKEREMCSQ